jgi:lipopolysaccharide/colanic/teichoic acid biosynthesis glycosyltransferase
MTRDRVAPVVRHASLRFRKRFMDLGVSLALILLLSPLLLLIAVLVKLTSPGPVLFRRSVQGLDGRPFDVLKFRSMVANAHEMMAADPVLRAEYATNLKIKDDPRLTRIGRVLRRASLDELPQLLNVGAGDMSLVGPRMLGDIELAAYGPLQAKVLSVKPGITGLWQISGRHRTTFDDRVRLDMHYIDHWSLAVDWQILIKTPLAVLSMAGAS